MPEHNYRVRIAIYDDVESTAENPLSWTDEPLYSDPEEISVQARRTQRHFLQDIAPKQ